MILTKGSEMHSYVIGSIGDHNYLHISSHSVTADVWAHGTWWNMTLTRQEAAQKLKHLRQKGVPIRKVGK